MNDDLTYFLSLKKYTLNYDESKIKKLNKNEKKRINNILEKLWEEKNKGELKICYRGDNYNNLKKTIYPQTGLLRKFDFYRKFFVLSPKSKICIYQTSQVDLDIAEVNEINIRWLFSKIATLTKCAALSGIFDKNFIDYFNHAGNADLFVNAICRLNEQESIKIRDYYYWLLHTEGGSAYEKSYFLSSSTELKVAKGFTNKTKAPLIILFFLPNFCQEMETSINSIKDLNGLINDLHLPMYSDSFYPEEYEVSVKGSIFSKYIIGVVEKDRLIVNPNIFDKKNADFENNIIWGLNIDYSRFDEEAEMSGFNSIILKTGTTYERQDIVK